MKCLEKKTDRQIVLTGALHLSDYVTMVTKLLGDQGVFPKVVVDLDPKVVLEFVLSLCYYSSYDYWLLIMTQLLNGCCLHPFPQPEQAKLPQNEAKIAETVITKTKKLSAVDGGYTRLHDCKSMRNCHSITCIWALAITTNDPALHACKAHHAYC